MSLLRKVFYYLVGVGMGILIVIFMFGDRDIQCSYFPNDRVLNDLRGKKLTYLPEAEEQMTRNNIDSSDISDILRMGDVDFSRSNTGEDTCSKYWVEYDRGESRKMSAEFRNCDSTVTLLRLYLNDEAASAVQD